jgi:hypothetical protein
MIIYKVVKDRDKSIVDYFLKQGKALQFIKDIQVWFTDSYHLESETVKDCTLKNPT